MKHLDCALFSDSFCASLQGVSDPISSCTSCAYVVILLASVRVPIIMMRSISQLRQKLTIVCVNAMETPSATRETNDCLCACDWKCHGACLLQRTERKFPLTRTHGCRHVLTCSFVAWRCSAMPTLTHRTSFSASVA